MNPIEPLRLEAVTFRYPTGDRLALDHLSIEANPGQITWLLGPLGAGCSTLLQVAAGLAPRITGGNREGRVSVLGVDPASEDGRRALAGRVGYVTAAPHLQLSGMTSSVWEEVAFGPANLGWPIERIRSAVASAMASLEIAHLAGRAPSTLSGGELQRTVIASMLVLEPEVWLLDQPAAALDVSGRRLVGGLLQREAARGTVVVIASEDADTMAELAHRLVVLGDGRIVLDGDPAGLLAGEEVWAAGVGSTSVAELARAAGLLEPGVLTPPYPLTVEQGVARWNR